MSILVVQLSLFPFCTPPPQSLPLSGPVPSHISASSTPQPEEPFDLCQCLLITNHVFWQWIRPIVVFVIPTAGNSCSVVLLRIQEVQGQTAHGGFQTCFLFRHLKTSVSVWSLIEGPSQQCILVFHYSKDTEIKTCYASQWFEWWKMCIEMAAMLQKETTKLWI